MSEQEKHARLFEEFPPVSREKWEEKIQADLKGADYEKKLIWKTPEGFPVKPYYRKEDLADLGYLESLPGDYPYVRGNHPHHNPWTIRQDILTPDVAEANRAAVSAVERGADAIGLNALAITTHKQMQQLLAGIDLDRTEIHFIKSRSYPLTLELFLYEVSTRENKGQMIRGSLNFDFISYLLLHGDFYISRENNLEEATYLVNTILKRLPRFRPITVNGHYFQDAGASLAEELAFTLASGHDYLSLLTSKGFEADTIARGMTFTFGLGSNYFMEIAKLRAARLLWAKIVEQYNPSGSDALKMNIHCQTARWNKTIYDPYVNMLRTTTEGMSGILGNTDSLSILPFNNPYAPGDDFGLRIARNQQLIMKEEAYLDRVADPAAGSYYIENLTSSLVHHAWNLFLETEDHGGMVEAVKSGFVQVRIAESRQQKEMDVAQRKLILLGTNQYPNLGEEMSDKISVIDSPPAEESSPYPRMKAFRAAYDFEQLRLATERYVAAGNKLPTVFLLTYGNLAMLRARAGFTTNFFGCAGYRIIDNAGFATAGEGAAAAIGANADIVVLCSSDEEYPRIAGPACAELRKSLPSVKVIVAGYPKDDIEKLKAAGVDGFIHVRSNILEVLRTYHNILGINL